MSKQTKTGTAQSTPEIYQSLNCAKENNNITLIEDVNHLFYIFEENSKGHLVDRAIHKRWMGLDMFTKEGKQTILTYHEEFFRGSPPEDQIHEKTALYTWNKIICHPNTVDRRPTPAATINGRNSTIGLCKYRLGTNTDLTTTKTPQAKECYRMFCECLEKNTKPEDADRHITEATLRQYIIDNASRLKTRQDPWRIFQYYRPTLITNKLITRE